VETIEMPMFRPRAEAMPLTEGYLSSVAY